MRSAFEPQEPGDHYRVPIDDGASVISEVEASLVTQVPFENEILRTTPETRIEWETEASRSDALKKLAIQSMKICRLALDRLAQHSTCALHYFVANDSKLKGFANKQTGIHINLKPILQEALLGRTLSLRDMSAYFMGVMAHEYAHFLKMDDGHGPDHGKRTEINMQALLHVWPDEWLTK